MTEFLFIYFIGALTYCETTFYNSAIFMSSLNCVTLIYTSRNMFVSDVQFLCLFLKINCDFVRSNHILKFVKWITYHRFMGIFRL